MEHSDTQPTAKTANYQVMSDELAEATAREIIRNALHGEERVSTAPVRQPDHRIVPAWAAGVAVASIGVGAGITGLGCGVWLACKGFAAVSLMSVLFVTLPIAAVAAVVVAVGSAIRAAKAAHTEHHHHYKGDVYQDNSQHSSKNTGLIAQTKNDHRRG
ncbi:hypothetical protein ACFXC8_13350 [Streptomyces sp. NPDC059441]|uniref:hypothetical protein n=1 Tax=Streptomyces sp. NPDC059441 TaxID=3346829 RepID=UPI00369A8B99